VFVLFLSYFSGLGSVRHLHESEHSSNFSPASDLRNGRLLLSLLPPAPHVHKDLLPLPLTTLSLFALCDHRVCSPLSHSSCSPLPPFFDETTVTVLNDEPSSKKATRAPKRPPAAVKSWKCPHPGCEKVLLLGPNSHNLHKHILKSAPCQPCRLALLDVPCLPHHEAGRVGRATPAPVLAVLYRQSTL
jgi:hypothetical protein